MNLSRERIAGLDVYYRRGTSDEQVITDVFEHAYHVPPNGLEPRTILDLGANIGLTMLDYRGRYPDAEILGVEMDAENVTVAYRNTDDPIVCAAVTETGGRVQLYDPEAEPWAYTLIEPGHRAALTVPLDWIGPAAVDLLKMDIEGCEASVLPDGNLSRFGAILVETHGEYTPDHAERDLQAAGFRTRADLVHERAVYAWRE